jgi:hypothetical protein
MRYLLSVLFLFFSVGHANERVYLSIENIHVSDQGIWFQYNGMWGFTQNLQFDGGGPFLEIKDEGFLGMWWCSNCKKWISDRCEICPTCGEHK